jgi:hypothetical protein
VVRYCIADSFSVISQISAGGNEPRSRPFRKEGICMCTLKKKPLIFLIAAVLLLTWAASPVLAKEKQSITGEDRNAVSMMFDLVLLRPLGLAATVVGTAFFVVSLPFSILGGNTGEAAKKLMVEPAKYTFTRPLGAEDY